MNSSLQRLRRVLEQYDIPAADLIRRVSKSQIVLPALGLSFLIQGLLWFLPAFLLKGHYPQATVSPWAPEVMLSAGLAVLFFYTPCFALWLWYHKIHGRSSQQLNSLLLHHRNDLSDRRWWHFPFSCVLFASAHAPYAYGLATDSRIEWFEPLGLATRLFVIGMAAVPTVLAGVTLWRIRTLLKVFNKEARRGLTVIALDPDGCGGLGFVGTIITQVSVFAVILNLNLVRLIVAPIVLFHTGASTGTSSGINALVAAALMIVFQGIAMWLVLFEPTVETRGAMIQVRDVELRMVSERFNSELKRSGVPAESKTATLQSLSEQYKLLRDSYPTLPFPVGQWWSLRVVSVIPSSIGLLGITIQLFGK